MSKFMKITLVGLSLAAIDAHAILPCKDRLTSFQTYSPREVEAYCDNYEKSFDKMAMEAGDSDEKKTLEFLFNSAIRVHPKSEGDPSYFFYGPAHQYKTFALEPVDALKVVRALPVEALESFPYLMKATHPERIGMVDKDLDKADVLDETMETIKKIPKDKLVNAALVAKNYEGTPKDFYKLVETTSPEKLLSLGTLMEKMPLKQALEMNGKYNQFEIVCGLSFLSSDETTLNANVKSCNEFKNGQLCKPKAVIFDILAKNMNKPGIEKFFKLLNSSDAYTDNQAAVIKTLFNDDRFSSIIEQLFKSENFTEELVGKIAAELEKPKPSADAISNLIKSTQPKYEKLGPLMTGLTPELYTTKEDPKCLTEEHHALMLSEKKANVEACEKYFADKNMIKCDVEFTVAEKTQPDDYKCSYDIKTTPYYSSPKAVSCYNSDLKSNIAALKNIAGGAKKNESLQINDSKIPKEVTPATPPANSKSTKTMSL